MDLRLLLASFLAAAATAQTDVVPPKVPPSAAKAVAPDAGPQDPEKAGPTSGTIIEQLMSEKERLQSEIAYAKSRAVGANKMLAEKLARRDQTYRSIDAGVNAPAAPQAMTMAKATILSEADLANHPSDVLMVVNGSAVRQSEFDELMNYMKSLSNTGTDEMRAQRVLFELIRTHSVAAAFPENEAEGQIGDVYAQVEGGKPLVQFVTQYGSVLGAQDDGMVEVTRNSFLGIRFEQVAFALKEGQRSRPFRTVFGFVVVEAKKMEKGASPELDKVTAQAVQVKYSADEAALNRAQAAASSGQAIIQVRNEAVMNQLPAMFRPTPAPIAPGTQLQGMQSSLSSIEAAIAGLASDGTQDSDVAVQRAALEKERDRLKAAIETMLKSHTDDGNMEGGIDGKVMPAVPAVPGKVKPGIVAPQKPGVDGDVSAEVKALDVKAADQKKAEEKKGPPKK